MTETFILNARLHSIINVQRANNEIIFVSADRLTEDFRRLQSKRLRLLINEPNGTGHATQQNLLRAGEVERLASPLILIPGQPIGKPRQTAADRWKLRPVVKRYRAWADLARTFAKGRIPEDIEEAEIKFFFAMPSQWSVKKRLQMDCTRHFAKPDVDNCIKSVFDALIENDEIIAKVCAEKFWTNAEPRTEVIFR